MIFFKFSHRHFYILIIFSLFLLNIYCQDIDDEGDDSTLEDENVEDVDEIEVKYVTPEVYPTAYLFETFDDSTHEKNWIKSSAKKDNVDENIAKYDGVWIVEPAIKDALPGDSGLILKSKAKHSAISAHLTRPFIFKDKPLIVQYEVNFQTGQECGGAYIKLLSNTKDGINLSQFNDKMPYTIMFGPDKCGNDFKLHLIFRHVNPVNNKIEEKHCKKPKDVIESAFKDNRPHLYTLILRPDNYFEVKLDHEIINYGNLLEDFTPAVNPPREIEDPNDFKPADWDEREKIADPLAQKPEEWDEEAPKQIVDLFAEVPEGWLKEEEELVADPEAVKPDDWDNEMDGEWEAPLVPNPMCEGAPGCGPWKAPMIDNPNFKGKWKAPMVDNPNYKGKWLPRRIHNPNFFEDLEPFKMTSIGAIGLELWSMSDELYFDNFIISDNIEDVENFATQTFDLKVTKIDKGQKSYVQQLVNFTNKHPSMYAVYVLALAVPVVIIFICCCAEDKDALKKKTDEVTEDDPHDERETEEKQQKEEEESKSDGEKKEGEEEEEEEEEEEKTKESETEEEEEKTKESETEEEEEEKTEESETED